MLNGVIINGVNTLTTYDFCLLADISLGAPALRRNTAVVPGGDGVTDLSYIYGRPVFEERTIKFNLFSRLTEAQFEQKRRTMAALWHGRRVTVQLPADTSRYWDGVLEFGDTSGFGDNILPVTLTAEPYSRYQVQTETEEIAASGSWSFAATNPKTVAGTVVIVNDKAVTVTFTNYFTGASCSLSLSAGTHDNAELYAAGLVFTAGANTYTFANTSTTDAANVTVTVYGREI